MDWIDARLSDEEVARLARQGGRPDLPARIAQMQRHKAVLSALPDVAAPMDLHDRVLAAMEREALVGLSTTDASSLRIASQQEEVRGGDRLGRFWSAAPRYALAAGLLLAVSGVTYLGVQAVRGTAPWSTAGGTSSTSGGGSLVASGDRGTAGDAGGTNAQGDAGSTMGALATGQGSPGAQGDSTSDLMIAGGAGERTLAGGAVAGGADAEALTIDQALLLAAEGRLLVRVQPREPQHVQRDLARLERINAEPIQRPWRLTRDVPATVVAAALPVVSPKREAPQFATADLIRPLVGPAAAMTALLPPADGSRALVASYLADVPSTSEGLDLMRAVLRERLRAEVTFASLPSAAPLPQRQDPATVLWWTQPPTRWHERVTVPVVVER